jgi:hypothetical protein
LAWAWALEWATVGVAATVVAEEAVRVAVRMAGVLV